MQHSHCHTPAVVDDINDQALLIACDVSDSCNHRRYDTTVTHSISAELMAQEAKRLCQRAEDDVLSSPFDPSYQLSHTQTQTSLLLLLQPVHRCLHSFLSAKDAARLMRTSPSIAASLLSDCHFFDHVFTFRTVDDCKRSIALYARYRLHILHMCLPKGWDEPLVDSGTGESVLPPSLAALTFGDGSGRRSMVRAAFDASGRGGEWEEKENNSEGKEGEEDASEFNRRIRPVNSTPPSTEWDVIEYGNSEGRFNQPIPPAALPSGLRYLQLNNHFDQPLLVGSIPDTVEVLQFGRDFNQPLEVGHLPASLTHLVCGGYDQPLPPGVLPAGLRRLHMGDMFNEPLSPGALPPQLQQLSFGYQFSHPIHPSVVPPSVTHLRLSGCFDHPLQPGSIPHGVVHLNLGESFNRPLLPGVLPTSLRELLFSWQFNEPLQCGSLPDGVEVVVFASGFEQTLQAGVIPASAVVVSLDKRYEQELVAGGIPATVKWLRLPTYYAEKDLSGVLSPSTKIVWWADKKKKKKQKGRNMSATAQSAHS